MEDRYSRDFQKLMTRVKRTIETNKDDIEQVDQIDQVKELISLERKFRNDVCKYSQANDIYKSFIDMMRQTNILTARSYFRKSSTFFNKKISKSIRDMQYKELMKFDINYLMIQYIVDNWEGELPKRSKSYYDKIIDVRRQLIENNLPLAVNRAKLFFNKTPHSHITLLDMVGICVCGLSVGIDKFFGNKYENWAGVSIGRMVGYLIEEYSKTFIRLYPTDRKILYRANSLIYRMKLDDMDDLVEAVNESFQKDIEEGRAAPKLPITAFQIRTLMNSSNYTSADVKINDGTQNEFEGSSIYEYSEDEYSLEEDVEQRDALISVIGASKNLTLLERKIIKLKGVDL